MNERQTREIDSIRRAHDFLRRQSDLSPELTVATRNLGHILDRIDRLAESLVIAEIPRGDATLRRRADQFRLRFMIPLSRRGRVLFRGEPRLERALRVPHKHDSVLDLVAAARAMLAAVTPHKKLFIAAGSPNTFVADFRAALSRLAAAAKERAKGNVAAPRIRRDLETEVARGRAEVFVAAGYMTLWLSDKTRTSTGLEAEWRSSRRITARLGRPTARRARNRAAAERRREADQ